MSELLKQSTVVTVLIGPFIDDTDGKTAETGLTLAQADVRLSKNAGNMAQKTEATSCTHDELGYYTCPLDATDTGTLGKLKLIVHQAGSLPVWHEFTVVPANVYDTLVLGSDVLTADVTQIGGVAQSATDLKDFADVGYDPSTNKVTGVLLTDTVTTLTGHTVQTGDGYAVVAHTDHGNAKLVRSTTPANKLDVSATGEAGLDFDNIKDASGAHNLTNITVPITTAVTNRVTANTDQIEGGDATDALETAVSTIKAKTDNLPTDPADQSLIIAATDAIIAALVTAQADLDNPDQFKADVSGLATSAALSTHDTKLTAVKDKTDNLPTDPADQSLIIAAADALVTAIAAVQTDLDNPDQFKADVSGLATEAALSTHDGKLDGVKAVTDKTDTAMELDGEVYRFTENALEQAPGGAGGGSATVENQTAIINHLTDVKGTGFVKDTDSLVNLAHISGPGAIVWPYDLTKKGTSIPIADADVWVTTDIEGNNVIESRRTDQNGRAIFHLDAGTVYIWRQKSGWNFDNPDTEEVS